MPQSRISPKTLLLLWGNMGKMGHRGGTGPRAFKWERIIGVCYLEMQKW